MRREKKRNRETRRTGWRKQWMTFGPVGEGARVCWTGWWVSWGTTQPTTRTTATRATARTTRNPSRRLQSRRHPTLTLLSVLPRPKNPLRLRTLARRGLLGRFHGFRRCRPRWRRARTSRGLTTCSPRRTRTLQRWTSRREILWRYSQLTIRHPVGGRWMKALGTLRRPKANSTRLQHCNVWLAFTTQRGWRNRRRCCSVWAKTIRRMRIHLGSSWEKRRCEARKTEGYPADDDRRHTHSSSGRVDCVRWLMPLLLFASPPTLPRAYSGKSSRPRTTSDVAGRASPHTCSPRASACWRPK
mmetsp:Transcript_17554/g.41771  ORF Transcript_17554/g.41771 Transcript_17554/m.41771 type:complete len:300 (-) Transcript_17554:116-1015(-)